jgi:hypothetical protein
MVLPLGSKGVTSHSSYIVRRTLEVLFEGSSGLLEYVLVEAECQLSLREDRESQLTPGFFFCLGG